MDCVAHILDFYNSKLSTKEVNPNHFSRLYLSNLLIKIMKNFSEGKTKDLELRNCLILLVNLFSDNDSPDHYNEKGKNVKEIIGAERSAFKEILKNEFLSN